MSSDDIEKNATSSGEIATENGRQISMIAIAGTIGTGSLANGGPVGALLGYLIVGMLVGLMMYSLGEMMSIVISYWDKNENHRAIYITVMLIGIILVNLAGVKYFGEFEFVFAFIKIITVIGLVIVLLVVDLGGAPDHDRRGFRYWRDQPFNNAFFNIVPESKARFLGFWAVLTQAAFSYGGMEGLAMICLEASNPRVTMKTAVRAIFYRIVLLYVFSILLIGMCVSRDNEHLLQAVAQGASTAAQSPFVIIIQSSGIKVLDHIINAVVLTSAFSSGNEFLYSTSRSLFMLAQEGKAPRIFSRVMSNGVPVYSLAVCSLFACLGYLACGKQGANDAFNWLANITTLGSMITWIGIALAHIRWSFISDYINIPFTVILYFGYKIASSPLAEMDCSTHYVEDSVVYSKY
ncbi:amino acid permease-domain-containing protein [Mycena olivaceomarginata]|nr:amino acid permease-domain-containing protein [Mycena olivaceomarginata]